MAPKKRMPRVYLIRHGSSRRTDFSVRCAFPFPHLSMSLPRC
jgi:hypothetical protein